jgi:ATP-binding cassette, subfamily B, bacterial
MEEPVKYGKRQGVTALEPLAWPMARLGEALEALARYSGLLRHSVETPRPPAGLECASGEEVGSWLEATASWLGLETEPVEVPYAEVEHLVRGAGPALLQLPGAEPPGFLVLLRGQWHRVTLLGPDLVRHRVATEIIRTALCQAVEAPLAAEVDRVLVAAGVPRRRQARTRQVILSERLSTKRLAGCWLCRLPAGGSFWQQMRQVRLPRRLLGLAGVHATQYLLWLLAWWLVGLGALQGRLDRPWLLAWGLLLLTLVPLRMLGTWMQGRLAIGVGGLLKPRLLVGVLRLAPEEIRHQGAGQLLGRVLESEAVEALALSGGWLGLLAGIELSLAAVVLSTGAAGWLQGLLLVGWVGGVAGGLGWRYFRQRERWTAARLTMTHVLVERLVGHRTRIAQESAGAWHTGEDQELASYLRLSHGLDSTTALLAALLPRGWLLVGLLGLGPAFVAGQGTAATIAVSVGGMLLAYAACQKLVVGLGHLAGAVLAWQQVAALFAAAARPQGVTAPALLTLTAGRMNGIGAPPLLEAHHLVFRHHTRGTPVLKGCSLCIRAGDRLLLEGPSGGGKSTLASLLTGLRQPEAGLVLLGGLDMQTLGPAGWRRRVVAAPQFHDNHVFASTLAFNLLMGHRWPPQPHDLEMAEALCCALGLGPLLDRMPSGLLQMVGETGWQLSHGERSRLYMARALLQGADVVILDESFAALDPETLHCVQQCVLARVPTLLVIAHP